MNRNDEKIISYLDGQMNLQEKADFEEELLHSEELRVLLSQYNSVYTSVETEKTKLLQQSYAESIIPEFRRRLEIQKPGLIKVRFVYAMSVFIIIASALYILNLLNTTDTSEQSHISLNDISNNDIEIFLEEANTDNFFFAFSDNDYETIDSIFIRYYSEAVIATETPEESLFALNDIDYQQIENILSEEEMDIVYNEIINKVLF